MVAGWFKAWKFTSTQLFRIPTTTVVDFIFFDSAYVYTTSGITGKQGTDMPGPSVTGARRKWMKKLHKGALLLPDSSKVPIGLMSFASGGIPGGHAFFVMPLPSYWVSTGLTSAELGLDNLITGVFLHEFSHTQQMQNFGKRIHDFETTMDTGYEFSDDIVQDIFRNDSAYTRRFRQETESIFSAAAISDKLARDRAALRALEQLKQRQSNYFVNQRGTLKQVDDLFLTMEGLGQYAMYAWLTHPKGAGIAADKAIAGVRRGKKQWSQDEGFALFLLLSRYAPAKKWAPQMFGQQTTTIVEILSSYLK